MEPKVYIVAVKGDSEDSVPPDWVDQLRAISGVQVRAGTRDQAVVLADKGALARLRAMLGNNFLIEEQTTRSF
jgi:hypothetical protein